MIIRPWQIAVEAQLKALDAVKLILKRNYYPPLQRQWRTDMNLLRTAHPYAWSAEPIAACLAASTSVPMDTAFNAWNVDAGGSMWWHFETPLPFKTVHREVGVRAVSFGWIGDVPRTLVPPNSDGKAFAMDTERMKAVMQDPRFVVSSWIDDEALGLGPTQVFTWKSGETIAEMLTRVKAEHTAVYGKGGRFEHTPQVGLAQFSEAAEGMARFILAGLTWMRQRVVVNADEPMERHRRKDYAKRTGQTEPRVQVVSLRRAESKPAATPGDGTRHLSVRFMVGLEEGGFFRNQPCGPKHGDRRLTFIAPFMKGPADAPLKLPNSRVFTVDR